MEEIKSLTSFSKASGCGCKLPPALLHEILSGLTVGASFENLLVGNDKADDASVFKINEETAIIQTVDFFTPIVNDPYGFGQIGAANSISDVYAMGGKPLMANVILGFPAEQLTVTQVQDILKGAASVCKEAGIPMAGGHSVNIGELIFGLSVTGTAHPAHIKTNSGAQAGDVLYLTKPLGTGILGAALKRGLATSEEETVLIEHCSRLNAIGEKLGSITGVHAMTDVTGFGLYGHLLEFCKGSGLSAELQYDAIPVLEAAKPYAAKFVLPDNTFRNWNALKDDVQTTVKEAFAMLNDPQTNGGLLIAVSLDAVPQLESCFQENGLKDFMKPIGQMQEKGDKYIVVL